MNHRQIEAFRNVMISGSTVRAAELMQITQPAVSRLISELERHLRFALFDRVRGRLVPTPEGQQFFFEVDESFKGLDRLRSAAAAIRDFGEGHLRIGSLSAAGVDLVPRAIREFRHTHPRIRISLQINSSSAVRNAVADGQYHIGLAADEIDRSGIDTQTFGSYPAVCVMPLDHPLAQISTIKPHHLRDVPLIGLAPEDRARYRFELAMKEEGVSPHYVVETPNSVTICSLVLSGDAIGIVNPLVLGTFTNLNLVVRKFEPQIQFRTLLLFRPDVQRSGIVKKFISCLLKSRNQIRTLSGHDI